MACFVKQLGAKVVMSDEGRVTSSTEKGSSLITLHLADKKGGDMAEWPEDLRVREFPMSAALGSRSGGTTVKGQEVLPP